MNRKTFIRKITSLAAVAALSLSVVPSAVKADTTYNSLRTYSKYNPVLKNTGSFTARVERVVASNNSNTYKLHDANRHIWVMVNESQGEAERIFGFAKKGVAEQARIAKNYPNYLWSYYSDKIKAKVYSNAGNDFNGSEPALGVLVQFEKAYDYYRDKFGWSGTDGSNSELVVNLSAKNGLGSLSSAYLNFINVGSKIAGTGSDGKPVYNYDASSLECVIHEYTHRVSANKVMWSTSNVYSEAGAVNEAYSDIMAEYGTNKDWISLAGTNRNATLSPSSGISGSNYYHYKAYKANASGGIDAHDGSTIISHAAYLMDSKYRIPANIAEQMWFKSMDYLATGPNAANFNDCRFSVIAALDTVLNKYSIDNATKDNYRVAVRTAFNKVGICPYYQPGDVNKDGRVNNSDRDEIKNYISKKVSFDVEKRALADVDFDGVVGLSDLTVISNYYN